MRLNSWMSTRTSPFHHILASHERCILRPFFSQHIDAEEGRSPRNTASYSQGAPRAYLLVRQKANPLHSSIHRGGEEVLLDVGGQDATEAFEDVGHSDEARTILDGLIKGNLKRMVFIPSTSSSSCSSALSASHSTKPPNPEFQRRRMK